MIALLAFCLAVVSCLDPYAKQRLDGEAQTIAAKSFIWAVASGDENEAISYLSTDAQKAVADYCDDGSVIQCFNALGREQWGNLDRVFFEFGTSQGANAFSTVWENDVILIVVLTTKENNRWVIDGWRGVVSGDEGWPEGILDGSNPVNQFPPTLEPEN